MDFSSVSRALESLSRRRQHLNDEELVNKVEECRQEESLLVGTVPTLLKHARWEPLAVGLYVATELLTTRRNNNAIYLEGPRVPSAEADEQSFQLSAEQAISLCQLLHETCVTHFEHAEPRIRTLVAKAILAYADYATEHEFLQSELEGLQNQLVTSIDTHIEQGREGVTNVSTTSQGALDDTTGWRALETNWQCLAMMVRATNYFDTYGVTEKLLEQLEYSCVTHVNRHVRAAGMACLEQMVVRVKEGNKSLLQESGMLLGTCRSVLKAGLADNWSQVRMAASVLCRCLVQQLQALQIDADDFLYPLLLPRMCLNRFYLAQGVKLYSHETWKLVFRDGSGLALVTKYLPMVVRYYAQMCDADNHVVREGACQALAELAIKCEKKDLQSFLPSILQALLMCFYDESWPVRDEACLACGLLVQAYPEECEPELDQLWERWTNQLRDPIWSVRRDAGLALGNALTAYPHLLEKMLALLQEWIPLAREQKAMTKAEFKALQNDAQAHTENQLYSCGSLAPKLKKKAGAGRIGCSSCNVDREPDLWEATDGCLYLVTEMIHASVERDSIRLDEKTLLPLLQLVADVCRVSHFPQGDDLRATLFKCLPSIATDLGKSRFGNIYWEFFGDLLFRTLENSSTVSALTIHAGQQCLQELGEVMGGPRMFRARLEFDSHKRIYDQVLQDRQSATGPMEDFSSPFGPPGLLDTIVQH